MKAMVNQKACIQCGACVTLCPTVFSIGDGTSAQAIPEPVPEGCKVDVQNAADSCPSAAISLNP